MPRPILYQEPLTGLPRPAFKIRMSGRLDPERIVETFLEAAGRSGEDCFYVLLDRRGMEPFAGVGWFISFFQRLREAGVTCYRSAVLDTDVHRPHMGALVQEAAIAAGLEAIVEHVWTEEEGLRRLRALMALPPPA